LEHLPLGCFAFWNDAFHCPSPERRLAELKVEIPITMSRAAVQAADAADDYTRGYRHDVIRPLSVIEMDRLPNKIHG
jgi:hypothetical protein